MAEKLTAEQVQHVARLSRLKLDDEELAFFTDQLSQVLAYVDKLGELDVDGVEPMAHPGTMTNRLRPDEPAATLAVEQALANAPASDPPYFKVPKVLADDPSA